jgi:hypothetical protein
VHMQLIMVLITISSRISKAIISHHVNFSSQSFKILTENGKRTDLLADTGEDVRMLVKLILSRLR